MLWESSASRFSLVGLLLIAIFTSRLAFGIATLPLALPGRHGLDAEAPGSWRRLQILVWFLVSLTFLPTVLVLWLTIGVSVVLTSRLPSFHQGDWFSILLPNIVGVLVLGIALCIVGKDGRATARRSIRLPDLKWLFIAFVFPTGIDIFISVGQFLLDRARWAAVGFGKFEAPRFGSYFAVPDAWLLFLIFGVFFEEVIFRGLLQPRFIQRYGLYRGIFLVGTVWAAFHFVSDFSFKHFTEQEALAQLCFRMFMCVTLSFVLAWLVLRSESILPAAIAHALYNVLVSSPLGPRFAGKDVLRVALWAALAYVSFRYWPASSEIRLGTAAIAESSEPAT